MFFDKPARLDSKSGRLYELLEYDPDRKHLTWRKPRADKDEASQSDFYAKLPARGIADVFRFVDEHCHFLSVLTPLQPRYAKKVADKDSLMAVIIAQALNHGNLSMSETSDIPYHILRSDAPAILAVIDAPGKQ